MLLIELKMLAEGLWGTVNNKETYLAPIRPAVKKLAEFSYDTITPDGVAEVMLLLQTVEKFYAKYRPTADSGLYLSPQEINCSDDSLQRMLEITTSLTECSAKQLADERRKLIPDTSVSETNVNGPIFIGHGRSKLWSRLQVHLKEDLGLDCMTFESKSHAGESVVPILEELLDSCPFAILILTAEDQTAEGKLRSRQNVIHEAGLFQGRLGFKKAIMLVQEGIEDFSNIHGLQTIRFSSENIEQAFYELGRVLKREGMLDSRLPV